MTGTATSTVTPTSTSTVTPTSTPTVASTVTSTVTSTVPRGPAGRGGHVARGDIGGRLAGGAGLAFVATVLAQNLIRGASAPANDASGTELLAHYAGHRTLTFVLVGSFLVGGAGLALFVGGTMRRLVDSERRGWAFTGLLGATGILSLFSVLIGTEQALSVVAGRSRPDVGAMEALWALHNGVFAVLWLSIAVALLGLSRAGVAAGITPPAYRHLGPAGAGLLVVAALAGPAIAAGDALPAFALGGAGFLIWLSFVLTTGLRLLRARTS